MVEDLKEIGHLLMTEGANKELQEDVLNDLRGIQEMPDFLRDLMSEDVKRYFNAASPAEQLIIKGAYFRTKWILNKLAETKDKKLKGKKSSDGLGISRYV